MQELSLLEIGLVGGAGKAQSGTLERPTRGESDWGKRVNDAFGAATAFGDWLGGKIYDWTHPHNAK